MTSSNSQLTSTRSECQKLTLLAFGRCARCAGPQLSFRARFWSNVLTPPFCVVLRFVNVLMLHVVFVFFIYNCSCTHQTSLRAVTALCVRHQRQPRFHNECGSVRFQKLRDAYCITWITNSFTGMSGFLRIQCNKCKVRYIAAPDVRLSSVS